jgi:hypothetical protein
MLLATWLTAACRERIWIPSGFAKFKDHPWPERRPVSQMGVCPLGNRCRIRGRPFSGPSGTAAGGAFPPPAELSTKRGVQPVRAGLAAPDFQGLADEKQADSMLGGAFSTRLRPPDYDIREVLPGGARQTKNVGGSRVHPDAITAQQRRFRGLLSETPVPPPRWP